MTLDEGKLRRALEQYNQNPKDSHHVTAIESLLGAMEVIHRKPDGSVDIDETIDSAKFAIKTRAAGETGCVRAAELLVKNIEMTPTDPVTRVALRKGKTTSGVPQVDWNGVPEPRMFTAGYAAETGQLPPGGSEMAAFYLKQATLQPPWSRLDDEATKLRTRYMAEKKAEAENLSVVSMMSQADRSLVERCLGRLSHNFEEDAAVAAAPSRAVPPPAPPRAVPGSSSSQASSAEMPQAGDSSQPKVFILAHDKDSRFVKDLLLQCHLHPGSRVTLLDTPPGADARAWVGGQMNSSAILVAVLSPDFLASENLMGWANHFRHSGKSVLPYVVRACNWKDSDLGGLKAINENKPADDYQAAVDLRSVVTAYMKKKGL